MIKWGGIWMKQWKDHYNKRELLSLYRDSLLVNHKALLDLMSLEFTLAEFTFYPKLTAFYQSESAREGNQKIGYYSALVYLSTKIHQHILTNCKSHRDYRKGVQFPILIGDLLYGKAIEAVLADEDKTLLEGYLNYLAKFNQTIVDYLNQQASIDDVTGVQFGDLAELTYRLMYKEDNILAQKGASLAKDIFGKRERCAENDTFCEELLKDCQIKITTWQELEQNLKQ